MNKLAIVSAKVPCEVIARLKNCRVVSHYGIGTDNVDMTAATAAGIVGDSRFTSLRQAMFLLQFSGPSLRSTVTAHCMARIVAAEQMACCTLLLTQLRLSRITGADGVNNTLTLPSLWPLFPPSQEGLFVGIFVRGWRRLVSERPPKERS